MKYMRYCSGYILVTCKLSMKYTLSEDSKCRALKRYIKSLSINYGISVLFFGYLLYINWNDQTLKMTLLLCLLMFPVFAFFFVKNMKKKLSITYEITDTQFFVKEGESVKKEIALLSIQRLTKTKNGYKVEFNNDSLYILDQIENKDELWEKLTNKAGR